MRLTEFIIVIMAALMFLIPTMRKETALEREAQEAPIEMQEEEEINTFKITYESKNPSEEAVADIIWMKKAAETARDAGIPYFNVLKQKIKKRYVSKYKTELSVVEGIIQLDNDPMRAEYDANEIEALVLTDQ
jgi:Na+-transporting methylmalonyl-CoA/oxaloacetate decarboxylase gamma subunit